jgi:hypothetical protein
MSGLSAKRHGVCYLDDAEKSAAFEIMCTDYAIKYLRRWKRKNGVEDLKKAVWYIERLIKKLEG